MSTTITQLWNGDLKPLKHLGSSEMTELETIMQRDLDDLEKILKGKAANRFDRYNDCVKEYICIACEQAFHDGFCLATKLLTEGIQNS